MSFDLTKKALEHPGLTPLEKLVLALLAKHANNDSGEAHPSLSTIGKEVGGEPLKSERHIRRVISSLRERNLIHQQLRKEKTPLYTFPLLTGGGRTPVSGTGGHPCPVVEDAGVREGRTSKAGGGRTPVSGKQGKREQVKEQVHKPSPPTPGGALSRDAGFAEFYKQYPKKVAKQAAFQSWMKLKVTPELIQQIMGALTLQKESDKWCRDGGQYIPNASTWINGKRWEDEIAPPVARDCTSGKNSRRGGIMQNPEVSSQFDPRHDLQEEGVGHE